MDISLRHLPDLSSSDGTPDVSDASFQIPVAASSSSELLLADDSVDFLGGVDLTMNTPARPGWTRHRDPLALGELTPRSRPSTRAATRSSLRTRPAIPSPLKQTVAHDLSTALEDTLSPLKRQDFSFQIPAIGNRRMDLLMADDSGDFFAQDVNASFEGRPLSPKTREPLNLSQLTSGQQITRSPHKPPISLGSTPIDENSDPSNPGNLSVNTSDSEYPRPTPPGLFSEPKTEIQTLVDVGTEDRQHAAGAFLLDPCIESSAEALEDVPENDMGGDTVETEMAEHFAPTPIRPEPFVAPDVPAMAVELRAQQKQKPKPAVIGGGIVKQSKPKLPTSTLTRTQTASTRKLRSQAPTEKSAGKHAVRVRAPNSRARTVRDKSPDAGKESCDMTISETSGLAAVLVAYGEKVITNTTNSLNSDTLKHPDRISRNGGVSTSVPESDLQRAPNKEEIEISKLSTELPSDSDVKGDSDRASAEEECPRLSEASPIETQIVQDAANYTSAINAVDNRPRPSAHIHTRREVPHEAPGIPTHPTVPLSPMRRSFKRSASPVPEEYSAHQVKRKRSEMLPPAVGSSGAPFAHTARSRPVGPSSTRGRKNHLQTSRKQIPTASSSQSSLSTSESGLSVSRFAVDPPGKDLTRPALATSTFMRDPSIGDLQKRRLNSSHMTTSAALTVGRASTGVASSSTASRSGESNSDNPSDAETGRQVPLLLLDGTRSMGHDQAGGHMYKARNPGLDKLTASLPAAKVTKPIEFHFQSEARLEARRAESSERAHSSTAAKRTRYTPAPIPDFKALHEAQGMKLAAIKEQIVPVLPGEIEFSTEARAHERDRYDEARRAREREAERLMEEKRRLQELEEEKEIKELRRRAVPKAHEIPEWYAHAPKRSHDARR